jgi:hypothetical protein
LEPDNLHGRFRPGTPYCPRNMGLGHSDLNRYLLAGLPPYKTRDEGRPQKIRAVSRLQHLSAAQTDLATIL